jgi:endonuclease/exonuclease/phosphatase family metal-dependent hydrolase
MKFVKISGAIAFISTLLLGCQTDSVSPLSSESATTAVSLLSKPADGRGELKVMDWNIYIGANVDIILSAENELDLLMKVAAAYDTLQMTNFPERAQAIAKQVVKFKPHVIALQEVSLIQRFEPGNPYPVDQLDFLSIMLNALTANGLNYQLADSVHNPDVMVPRLAGVDANGAPMIDYVRVLDADVILVRHDVSATDVIKGHYTFNLEIPSLGITLPRGYVSINAGINGRHYRIVNTHLEAFGSYIRLVQAGQLVSYFANETLPVVMMGDFNTDNLTPPNPYMDETYQLMTGSTGGYYDAWDYNLYGHQSDGMTYGHASDLMNPDVNLYERIDFVFVGNTGPGAGHNPIGPVYAEVIGDELADRTVSGLWPSDHAGIIARLHISAPETVAAK